MLPERARRIPEQPGRREPIEGVDYLINRFAVLGVPSSADKRMIDAAFRKKMALYHSDKYETLAPEFQAEAAFMTRQLTQAHAILTDDKKREAHRKQLEQWQAKKKPISDSGHPITTISYSRSLYYILGDPSKKGMLEEMLQYGQQMSGSDPVVFSFIEQQFNSTPNPSPALEQAYRKALSQRDDNLTLQESFHRQFAGLDPYRATEAFPPRDYLGQAKADIAEGRESLVESIAVTTFQLHSGAIQMLGSPEVESLTEAVTTDPNTALAHFTQQATQRYDADVAEIERLAAERQELMESRLALVKGEYPYGQTHLTDRLLVNFSTGKVSRWLAILREGNDIILDESISQRVLRGLNNPKKAREMIEQGFTIMSVMLEKGLPVKDQVDLAVVRHYELLDSEKEKISED